MIADTGLTWASPHQQIRLTPVLTALRKNLRSKRFDNIKCYFEMPQKCKDNDDMHFALKSEDGADIKHNLMEMCCLKMHKYAPQLEDSFQKNVEQYNVPSSKLFLRLIGCYNMVSLQTLARRLRAFEASPEDKLPTSLKQFHDILATFPVGIQEDIKHMIHLMADDPSAAYLAVLKR